MTVLFLFIFFIYPSFVGIIQGQCWAHVTSRTAVDVYTAMRDAPKTVSITLGDCVEQFAIIPKNKLSELKYKDELECPPNALSLIVATPDIGFFQFLKQQTIVPVCKEVPCKSCTVNDEGVILDGPGNKENSKEYCLTITKSASRNSYSISTECEE